MFSLTLLFLLTSADESEETIDCFCPPERGLPGTGCTERHFILCNSCHQGFTLEHVWITMPTWMCNPQPVEVTNEDFEEEQHSAYSSDFEEEPPKDLRFGAGTVPSGPPEDLRRSSNLVPAPKTVLVPATKKPHFLTPREPRSAYSSEPVLNEAGAHVEVLRSNTSHPFMPVYNEAHNPPTYSSNPVLNVEADNEEEQHSVRLSAELALNEANGGLPRPRPNIMQGVRSIDRRGPGVEELISSVDVSTDEPVDDDALLSTSTPMDPSEPIVSEMEGEHHYRDYQPCIRFFRVDMDALFAYEDIFGTDHDLGLEDFEIRSP